MATFSKTDETQILRKDFYAFLETRLDDATDHCKTFRKYRRWGDSDLLVEVAEKYCVFGASRIPVAKLARVIS